MSTLELGLGLLSIGRSWGVKNISPPSETKAYRLIEMAFERGIRFFDTAPAYAHSEKLLGKVLKGNTELSTLSIIATKFGEHWEKDIHTTRTSHSRDDLLRSLENSMNLLNRIDILQLHKATQTNVTSDDVVSALEEAKKCGIQRFGASVGDKNTAILAIQSGIYEFIQFPFNSSNTFMKEILHLCQKMGVKPIINRPFAMGTLAIEGEEKRIDAFRFIRGHILSGIVLTGTSNTEHLLQNITAFEKSKPSCG